LALLNGDADIAFEALEAFNHGVGEELLVGQGVDDQSINNAKNV
jgi:hypothetical protein